jgi:hypothetical protein
LYKKYKHKRTKHILLELAYRKSQCFIFVHNFSLPLIAPIFIYILFSSTCTIASIFIQIGYRNSSVIYPCTHCISCQCNKYLLKKIQHYVLWVVFSK